MADKTPEQIASDAAKAAATAKPAPAAALTPPAADAAPKVKSRKLRVLADAAGHSVNDVITLSDVDADAAVAGGWADDHPSAVKYAEGLAKAAASAE